MLLAIDIGNTSLSFGLFQGPRLVKHGRIPERCLRSAAALARSLLAAVGKRNDARLEGVCVVSVVPALDALVRESCRRAFGIAPFFATAKTIGMPIRGYDRRQVGADRLIAALAAYARTRRATIVIDAGTAITIDLVTSRGVFSGGAIVPGLAISAAALHAATAQLPLVRVRPVRRARGRATEEAIRAGLFHGAAGLVVHLVRRIAREARVRPRVIATGGDAELLAQACPVIDEVRPTLVLEGLRLCWENHGKGRLRRRIEDRGLKMQD